MIRATLPLLLLSLLIPAAAGQERKPKSRTFLFTYTTTISDIPAGKKVRIWLPVPTSSEDQEVSIVDGVLPLNSRFTKEKQYGNHLLYSEVQPADDKVTLTITYRVTRKEVLGLTDKKADSESLVQRYLQPDSLVPVTGKPLELIKDKKLPDDPLQKARVLYDVVNQHMVYSKDKPGWGRGDAVWACDSKFGNCTDFHSLFISLARAQKIPSKFEIGFSIPEKRGQGEIAGYHCWAKFRPSDKGWIGVDVSEANKNPKMKDYYFGNLTEDRVTFSTGRDIDLEPKQAGKPLNFLIYPYVEIDGKPVEGEQAKKMISNRFTYKDSK